MIKLGMKKKLTKRVARNLVTRERLRNRVKKKILLERSLGVKERQIAW